MKDTNIEREKNNVECKVYVGGKYSAGDAQGADGTKS
jgi:hypothetical protein